MILIARRKIWHDEVMGHSSYTFVHYLILLSLYLVKP